MTKLLEQAIDEVRRLPERDQDEVAAVILERLHADRAWDKLFSRPASERFLASLAQDLERAKAAGQVEPLDLDAI